MLHILVIIDNYFNTSKICVPHCDMIIDLLDNTWHKDDRQMRERNAVWHHASHYYNYTTMQSIERSVIVNSYTPVTRPYGGGGA